MCALDLLKVVIKYLLMHPIKRYHQFLESKELRIFDDLFDDDVIFYSPVVHTPQRGKDITKMYLTAAGNVFNENLSNNNTSNLEVSSKFKYVKEVIGTNSACLEFETTIRGIFINGIDLISWNDQNKITEFKVLIRPLKAVNILHEMMGHMLKKLQE